MMTKWMKGRKEERKEAATTKLRSTKRSTLNTCSGLFGAPNQVLVSYYVTWVEQCSSHGENPVKPKETPTLHPQGCCFINLRKLSSSQKNNPCGPRTAFQTV